MCHRSLVVVKYSTQTLFVAPRQQEPGLASWVEICVVFLLFGLGNSPGTVLIIAAITVPVNHDLIVNSGDSDGNRYYFEEVFGFGFGFGFDFFVFFVSYGSSFIYDQYCVGDHREPPRSTPPA